jgi:hypothetical protein
MKYQIERSTEHAGSFAVVAVDAAAQDKKIITQFFGPDAKRRAEEYARWKNHEPVVTNARLLTR